MTSQVLGRDIQIEDGTIPAISPFWHLKNSGDWIILSKYQAEEMSYAVLSPLVGATLPLINGKLSIRHLSLILQYAHDLDSFENARNILISIIDQVNKNGDVVVEMKNELSAFVKEYDALEYIQTKSEETKQKRPAYPLSLTVMFSNNCETNCVYCYANRRHVPYSQQLSTKRWIEIFHEASSLGMELISLSGGDPLFRDDAITLIGELIKLKMLFLISTKCHITNEKADRLLDAGMTEPIGQFTREIQISMDGPDEKTADTLAGSPGYFYRAVDSIKNLKTRGFNFRVKAVVTPLNASRIYDWVKLLVELGVNKFTVAAYNRTFFRHNDNLFLSEEDRELVGEQCNRAKSDFAGIELKMSGLRSSLNQKEREMLAGTNPEEVNARTSNSTIDDKAEKWKTRTHCSGGRSSMVITPDGKVVLCDTVPQDDQFIVGDVSTQSVMEVWNGKKLLDFTYPSRDKFIGSLCYECNSLNECLNHPAGYCFRNSFFNYGKIFGPPPECPMIPDSGLRFE